MNPRLLLVVLYVFVVNFLWSQQSIGGLPLSQESNSLLSIEQVKAITLPAPDVDVLLAEDNKNAKQGLPQRMGQLLQVDLNPNNSGQWTNLPSGGRVWQLRLNAPGAKGINLAYSDFYLPEGATLYIFDPTYTEVLGAFTSINNKKTGVFATGNIRGDELILEYYEPKHAIGQGRIQISEAGYVYRSLRTPNLRASDPCQVDVNCTPEGNNWQDEKRGVVRILIRQGNSQYWCSGSLMNNTNQDCKPYILTALHCGVNSTANDFAQYIFYFNYESSSCGVDNASSSQSIVGCTSLADSGDDGGDSGSDFLLIELNSSIPDGYNAYFNGWNAQSPASTSGVSIHHPSGDRKKISTYTQSLTSASWGSAPGSHWRVYWSETANGYGVTEGGSSGSPIFDNNGRVIGQLTGGSSYCVTPGSPDYYGKMSYNWESNPGDKLKAWLDPAGTGFLSFPGAYKPCEGGGGGDNPIDPTCPSTITSYPYQEGFENELGAWSQSENDDFDWRILEGRTISNNTGPEEALEGDYYIYVESSSPNYPNKSTILLGPCFAIPEEGRAVLTFNYHLFGNEEMGDLTLESRVGNEEWTSIWSTPGNLDNTWNEAEVDLAAFSNQTVQVRFVGTTGTTWQGDIAIDNLNLSIEEVENCSSEIDLPYIESFERDLGAWTQDEEDELDWERRTGSTPSGNTGPRKAFEGDYYIYLESSFPNYPNKSAILNSPCIDLAGANSGTLSFKYHMYGREDMGSLKVEAKMSGGNWESIWTKDGNQGNEWLTAEVSLERYLGKSIEVRLIANTTGTWQGDIAIDALEVKTASEDEESECGEIIVGILFDNYPEETSWELTDDAGNIIAAGGTYGSAPDGSMFRDTLCLLDGCYQFTIFDSYGDGICCTYGNGAYALEDAEGEPIASGTSFGSSETTRFCITNGVMSDAVVAEDRSNQIPTVDILSVYPNPTRGLLNISYKSKETQQAQIRVFGSLGQTLFSQDWELSSGTNQTQLDVQDWEAGNYWFAIEGLGGLEQRRFVILK